MTIGAFRDYKRRVSLRYPRAAPIAAYQRLARRKQAARDRLLTYALVVGAGLFCLGYLAALVRWYEGCIATLVQ